MARTQDLLVGRNWAGATVADLVRIAAGAVCGGCRPRASRCAGPDLELKPDAVHSLTLALHELATNAAKYGALSVPDGRVAVNWEVAGRETRKRGASA